MSQLEETLYSEIEKAGLRLPDREYRFHPTVKWRFDFAYPDMRVAIEIEGGTWRGTRSRHSNPIGYEKDCIKYNEATIMGWRVYRFTGGMVRDGRALDMIRRVLNVEDSQGKLNVKETDS